MHGLESNHEADRARLVYQMYCNLLYEGVTPSRVYLDRDIVGHISPSYILLRLDTGLQATSAETAPLLLSVAC